MHGTSDQVKVIVGAGVSESLEKICVWVLRVYWGEQMYVRLLCV
jgi:hypothetical protein